jgi:hypothetical protein
MFDDLRCQFGKDLLRRILVKQLKIKRDLSDVFFP